MNSKNYWARRGEELMSMVDNRSKLTFDEVNKLYTSAMKSISERIRKIYSTFADGNSLTPEQAKALLTAKQTREARAVLQAQYDAETDVERKADIRARMDAPAYQWRISKLEAVLDQIRFDCQAITTPEIRYGEARLKDVYTEAYYREAYAQSVESGSVTPFSKVTDQRAAMAAKMYWSSDGSALGKQFSDRVWENTTELAEKVRTIITEELLTGGNYREMMYRLDDAMGHAEYRKKVDADGTTEKVLTGTGASYRSARLIRTECNHIAGQAVLDSLKDAGTEKYTYFALLERRTCKVCGKLDGKSFPVAEQKVGVNMHPMHPNCRCFIGPYRPEEERTGRRTAESSNGGWMYVPQTMTYQEWYRKYVEGNPPAVEKAVRNRAADKEQLAKYQSVLGENAPKTLEDFQNLKYNDGNGWGELHTAYQDEELKASIRAGEYNMTVNPEKQARHLLDSDGYIPGRSYLNIAKDRPEEVQALISQYAGTGAFPRDRNGNWKHTEIVTFPQPIGYVVRKNGAEIETNQGKIHYSNTGTHIVPFKGREGNGRK